MHAVVVHKETRMSLFWIFLEQCLPYINRITAAFVFRSSLGHKKQKLGTLEINGPFRQG